MKSSSKNLEKCQIEVSVTLDADETKAIVKDVEKVFLREAQIPGFRKGKVPIEIIRTQFAGGLKQEIQEQIVRKTCTDAVKAENPDFVAITNVKDIAYGDEGASYVVTAEIRPTFKLPTYKGLKIGANDTTVKDEAVNDHVAKLRASVAKYEDAKEGDAVQEGDFAQIDYEGTVGKKPILEVAPEAKAVAGGKGFWFQVEEGHFLPEILDAVKGMKAGEKKEGVKAKFDKNAAPEGLKGAKAEYDVTLLKFRRRILPTDAELAEKMKAESFEKLVADIRSTMEKRAVEDEAIRRENAAVELLLKKVDFDVPASQVHEQMETQLKTFAERAQYSGLDASYFEKNREQILKDAETASTQQVRLWYLLDAIVKAEKIECKPEEAGKKAIEFVLANAKK